MGLMDLLQPFAKGYVGARVEQMEAKAEAQREKDKLLAEEASAIRLYTAQARIDAEKDAADLLTEQKRLKTQLLSEGMKPELIDILAPQLYNTDTYNSYLDKYHGGNPSWFMTENINGVTQQDFIISNQKDNAKKETESTAINGLTGQDGPLRAQDNAAKVLTSTSLASTGFEGARNGAGETVVSPFPASFPDNVETQNQEQINLTGKIDSATDTTPAFTGAIIPPGLFVTKPIADITNSVKNTRNSQKRDDILETSGIQGMYDAQGNLQVNTEDVARYNMLAENWSAIANEYEFERGQFINSGDLALLALNEESRIKNIVNAHVDRQLDDTLQLAIKNNVIDETEAFNYMMHKNLQDFSNEYGLQSLQYYIKLIREKDPALADDIEQGQFIQRPDGMDNLERQIDDAVIGSIETDEDEIFNDDGDVIEEEVIKTREDEIVELLETVKNPTAKKRLENELKVIRENKEKGISPKSVVEKTREEEIIELLKTVQNPDAKKRLEEELDNIQNPKEPVPIKETIKENYPFKVTNKPPFKGFLGNLTREEYDSMTAEEVIEAYNQ